MDTNQIAQKCMKKKILPCPLSEPTLLTVENISLQFSSCLSNKHVHSPTCMHVFKQT